VRKIPLCVVFAAACGPFASANPKSRTAENKNLESVAAVPLMHDSTVTEAVPVAGTSGKPEPHMNQVKREELIEQRERKAR
jgi:hypothetical protein